MSDRDIGIFFVVALVIALSHMAYTAYYCEYTGVSERGPKGNVQEVCRVK